MTPLLKLAVIASTLAVPCFASDPHEVFLQGLRERGYFDTALEYLDVLSDDPETPADLRTTLDLKRAAIWVERSEAARRKEDREQFVGQGQAAYESFLKEHPQHHEAAWAHAQTGQLLFERARYKLLARSAPGNSGQHDQMTETARQLLVRARDSFSLSRDLSRTQMSRMPFVDQETDEKAWQLRRDTESRYVSAWLRFVNCIFEEALTYGPESGHRSELLTQATRQFQDIHTFSVNSGAGQHAKLMMGRCQLELGDISQALGYFDELRRQTAKNPQTLRRSHTAQYYRLSCLNHESRREYQNVVNEASRWLRQHPDARNTKAGLGILYEKSVAAEVLARTEELTAEQRQLRLRQTLADQELVGAVASPVQENALTAARRLRSELGQNRREPKTFDAAFDRGREIIEELQEARHAAKLAETEDQRTQAAQELELLESEAGRLFQLALKLREHGSDRSAVAQSRYLLSYVFLQQRKYHDAFVLARHVMRRHGEDAPETAGNASEMAISAAGQLLAAAPKDDRLFELTLVREICEEVVQTFAGSRQASDARMRLGGIYLDLDLPQLGAEAFEQVPQDDAGYATARIAAGQAWYRVWAEAGQNTPADSRVPGPATLNDWKQHAKSLLTEGLRLSRAGHSGSSLSDEIVKAEVSLCGLLNEDGEFAETVRHLTHGNPAVLSAVESDGRRPQHGVKSAAFAGLCYRFLLRAYVGTQQIDDALEMMQRLQTLGASNTTSVYTQLGQELQQELKRLQDSGQDKRLQQVRTSFERFLEKVYSSRDHSSNSALLWIAETYTDIARGNDDPEAAKDSYDKVATIYQELLNSKLDEVLQSRLNLRLIRTYRQQKKFLQAVELGTEELKNHPASVSVQLEVAHVLADWGDNGEPERLLESIRGVPADRNPKTIWGWAALARRLLNSRQQEVWTELKPLFLEARFELSNSRLRYARIDPDGGQKQLEAAAREIMSMAQVFHDFDDEWWDRFNSLYEEVQTKLGRPGLTLNRPDADAAPTDPNGGPSVSKPVAKADAPVVRTLHTGQETPAGRSPDDVTFFLMVGIGLMVVVVGGISFVIMRRPRRRVRSGYTADLAGFQFNTGLEKEFPGAQTPPRSLPNSTPALQRKQRRPKTQVRSDGKPGGPPRKPVSRSKPGVTSKPRRKQRRQPPAEE